MKVEQSLPGVSAPSQTAAIDSGRVTPPAAGPVGSDSVQLSPDLRLAYQAIQAAGADADVRPEAVARGQALIASGQAGADLGDLADRILDAIPYPHDPDNP